MFRMLWAVPINKQESLVKAIIKFSGIEAAGLTSLHTYLERDDLNLPNHSKQFVVLKDSRLEEGKKTYLVTLEVILADTEQKPKFFVRLPLFLVLFHAINPRLLPKFDCFGDAERDLQEFQVLAGKIAPFDVTEKTTGLIILQKGKSITLRRLEEVVGSKTKSLSWNLEEPMTEDGKLLHKLLAWRDCGGATDRNFDTYQLE